MSDDNASDLSDEYINKMRSKYEELCRELNMDKQTEEDAWNKYMKVAQRCSLEGESIHWFCCALYSACRETITPTVGGPDTIVMGNCVPLNNLLRSCHMSIYDFTTKIKQWADMANLSKDFLRQIKDLERKFSITFTLFQRYKNIFEQLFSCPPNERRNTKFRSANKCSFGKLYDICWRLFLSAKNQKPTATVDLVTSFHLLICCIDLIYSNVLYEKRIDLVNPDFKGVPKDWNTPQFDIETVKNHCIIDDLCQITDAISEEAKNMKQNSWRITMQTFFKTNTIYGSEDGDSASFLGILSNNNMERNLKSLNCAYEHYVLSVGEFDERIMANYRCPSSQNCITDSDKFNDHQSQQLKAPATPYTRQQFLPRKENFLEPVANATNNVRQLQVISRITEATDFIKQAGAEAIHKINEIMEHMSNQFYIKFPNRVEAANRLQLAKSLYFYLLENIVRAEIKAKPNIDLKRLLDQQAFNTTLMACCIELVLEAYNSQLKFPWILNCFNLSAFQFHKIIEIVVLRHDNVLTRALIKHLNSIEETCLESLAWQKNSTVWSIIDLVQKPLPTWNEVDGDNMAAISMRPPISPMINSAYETFNSTPGYKSPTQAIIKSAIKAITKTTISSTSGMTTSTTTNTNATATKVAKDLFNSNGKELPMLKDKPTTSKPIDKRAGSLPIFLRKFYKLAWLRISKLCTELDMRDKLVQKKIWTLFEHSITEHTHLMQDRHLDQILMCAIYIYIRVGEVQGKTFTDIMKFYRKQPQATSSIYREVLIEPPTENAPAQYNDIIYFYNNIYVRDMTKFSLNFNEKKKSKDELLLSPHPQERQTVPKKLTHNHSLYVSPMQKNEIIQSPNQLTYEFCKSPAKNLQLMNEKVSGGKRFLPFDDINAVLEQKRAREMPLYLRNLEGIIKDRKKESK